MAVCLCTWRHQALKETMHRLVNTSSLLEVDVVWLACCCLVWYFPFKPTQSLILQLKLKQQMQVIDNDHMLDLAEKTKRKQNLLLLHSLNQGNNPLSAVLQNSLVASSSSSSNVPVFSSSLPASSMSPLAPSFYPAGDTVESVIG